MTASTGRQNEDSRRAMRKIFLHIGTDADDNSGHIQCLAMKKPTESDTRLEVRLSPHAADQLKDAANETGISINRLMKSICIWTASNLQTGKPTFINDTLIGSSLCDGMFWLDQPHKALPRTHPGIASPLV